MIWYSRNCVRTIMNLVFDSTKVNGLLFIILTYLTKFLKFCVIEVFKLWMRYRYEENKEWKDPKLGDARGTPR